MSYDPENEKYRILTAFKSDYGLDGLPNINDWNELQENYIFEFGNWIRNLLEFKEIIIKEVKERF